MAKPRILLNDDILNPRTRIEQMKNILVLGSSCSGKSTFSKNLSSMLEIQHIELDALFWEPNWVETTPDVFRSRVNHALELDQWILDGNFLSKIKDIVWDKIDTIIWLDPSLRTILIRFLSRSIIRAISREVLWNGCRESLRNSIFKKNSLLVWILTTHKRRREDYTTLMSKASASNIVTYHLKNQSDLDHFRAHITDKSSKSKDV